MSINHDHRKSTPAAASADPAKASETLDSFAFRQVMSQYVTGVTVVTSAFTSPDETASAATPLLDMHGMTCNSFASVSSETSCISVCLTKATRTARLIAKTGVFAVNILAADQADTAHRFAGRHKEHDSDRFQGIAWQPAVTIPVPILTGAKAIVECRLLQEVDCGDHTLFIGRVTATSFQSDVAPLVFYKSRFVELALTGV